MACGIGRWQTQLVSYRAYQLAIAAGLTYPSAEMFVAADKWAAETIERQADAGQGREQVAKRLLQKFGMLSS